MLEGQPFCFKTSASFWAALLDLTDAIWMA
jgi:hypothetical protein